MSNKDMFLAKASNLASRFEEEDEIMEEADEYYESNQEDNG